MEAEWRTDFIPDAQRLRVAKRLFKMLRRLQCQQGQEALVRRDGGPSGSGRADADDTPWLLLGVPNPPYEYGEDHPFL